MEPSNSPLEGLFTEPWEPRLTPASEVRLPKAVPPAEILSTPGDDPVTAYIKEKTQVDHAKLKRIHFNLTPEQFQTVVRALDMTSIEARNSPVKGPSRRGNALYQICQYYLQEAHDEQ